MSGFVFSISGIFFFTLMIASLWRVFEKAGRSGWESLIPIYNLYRLVKISGKSGIWMLLFLLPFVNIIAAIALSVNIAKQFGESTLFGLGMVVFPYLFWPILGLGDSVYLPKEAEQFTAKDNGTTSNTFVNEEGDTVEKISLEDW